MTPFVSPSLTFWTPHLFGPVKSMFFKIGMYLVIIRCGKKKRNLRVLICSAGVVVCARLLVVSVRLLVVFSRLLVVCGNLWWFLVICWWFMIVCGCLLWFAGGLWWFVVVASFSNYAFSQPESNFEAETEIRLLQQEVKKQVTKTHHGNITLKIKQEIGNYAAIHGTKAAFDHFSKTWLKFSLKRPTVKAWKEKLKKGFFSIGQKKIKPNLVDYNQIKFRGNNDISKKGNCVWNSCYRG